MKRLGAFARAKVEAAAHEAANTALPRMKDRFSEVRVPPPSALGRLRPGPTGACSPVSSAVTCDSNTQSHTMNTSLLL